jgi:hypothetical protein
MGAHPCYAIANLSGQGMRLNVVVSWSRDTRFLDWAEAELATE